MMLKIVRNCHVRRKTRDTRSPLLATVLTSNARQSDIFTFKGWLKNEGPFNMVCISVMKNGFLHEKRKSHLSFFRKIMLTVYRHNHVGVPRKV